MPRAQQRHFEGPRVLVISGVDVLAHPCQIIVGGLPAIFPAVVVKPGEAAVGAWGGGGGCCGVTTLAVISSTWPSPRARARAVHRARFGLVVCVKAFPAVAAGTCSSTVETDVLTHLASRERPRSLVGMLAAADAGAGAAAAAGAGAAAPHASGSGGGKDAFVVDVKHPGGAVTPMRTLLDSADEAGGGGPVRGFIMPYGACVRTCSNAQIAWRTASTPLAGAATPPRCSPCLRFPVLLLMPPQPSATTCWRG